MKRLSIAVAIALCLTTVVVASPATAENDCQNPAEGVTICDSDEDPEPEQVELTGGDEGNATLTITYEETERFFSKNRKAEASAQTGESSPVGANEVDVRVTCEFGEATAPGTDQQVPCQAVGANALAEESFARRASVRAGCDGIATGPTPACTLASGSVDARFNDTGVRLVVICGSAGFFGSTPCPLDASYGATVYTPQGDVSVFGGAQPLLPGAFVCEDDPATGQQCAQ